MRFLDFVYHSTLGLRVIKKKKKNLGPGGDKDRGSKGYRSTSLIRNSTPPRILP